MGFAKARSHSPPGACLTWLRPPGPCSLLPFVTPALPPLQCHLSHFAWYLNLGQAGRAVPSRAVLLRSLGAHRCYTFVGEELYTHTFMYIHTLTYVSVCVEMQWKIKLYILTFLKLCKSV